MTPSASPLNNPSYLTIDARDLDAIRKRLSALEDDNNTLHHQLSLLMQGMKERLDEHQRLLLARSASPLAREDVA